MNSLIYVPSSEMPRLGAYLLLALRWLLAAFFVFVAVRNLAGDAQMAADFRRWGYPDWFRVTTALLQSGGAVLLLNSRVAFLGGVLLGCVLLGAVYTHLRHDPPATLVAPFVFIALVTPVLLTLRPPLLR